MPDFDDWIDAQLRNVPLPTDLLWRLAEAGRSQDNAAADARLDAVISNVPVPLDLQMRLRRIAYQRRPHLIWRPWGIAAAIVFLISAVGYLGVVGVAPPQNPTTANLPQPTLSEVASRTQSLARAKLAPIRSAAAAKRSVADTAEEPIGESMPPSDETVKLPFGYADVAAWSRSAKSLIDERMKSQAALGAGGEFNRLPELDSFESLPPRGIMPPRVRGYDLLFHLKQGEQPFASPSSNKALASSRMPFTFRTASYDQAVSTTREGEAPSGDDIRVEDFLAAQEYALPAAPVGSLALHTAAVNSPFRDGGLHLMQLVVKAGSKKAAPRETTRLIAIVDISARMAAGSRWEAVLRALTKFADDMRAADRVTLIGYTARPLVLAANSTGPQLLALLASDSLPQLAGSADFAVATRSAVEAIKATRGKKLKRIVFVTAGREIHGDLCLEKSRESLAELSAEKIPWRVVRLSANDDQQQLNDLAREAQGTVTTALSASELRAGLWEHFTGESSTVANRASLKLTFNPKVVTSYRLMGHGSGTITGDSGDPLEVDLSFDQTATAMYELFIKPGGGEQIAGVELSWHDPANGRDRRVAQWIRRGQISESFSQAPAWFQQGVIAAKTAEVMRGSYFASGPRVLEHLRDLARQVDPHTARQPDFQALLRLLEQIPKTR